MSIPEQIKANAQRANELIKQLNEGAATGDEPAADEANSPTDTGASETGASAPATPSTAPAVAQAPARQDPAPVPAAGDTRSEDENNETFAQRWRTLQGVHNSVQSKLRESEAARQNLERLVAQMQSAPAQPARPRASHLTDKDNTEFGADMVDFARRAARDEMAPLAQAFQALAAQVQSLTKLAPVVQTVASAQVATTREQFYADLTRLVPDWRQINEAQPFHGWLLETDPFTGLQRDTLLKDAHDNLDLGRVVSIFNAFKRLSGAQPQAASAPAQAAVPAQAAAPSARERLERQVAPGRASTGSAPPQPNQKKQWTREDIAAFYRDKMAGRYKGREQEMQALERDIFDAQREGRVVLSAA